MHIHIVIEVLAQLVNIGGMYIIYVYIYGFYARHGYNKN